MGGTVYCRWCYNRGHNKRTCPEYTETYKERAEAEVLSKLSHVNLVAYYGTREFPNFYCIVTIIYHYIYKDLSFSSDFVKVLGAFVSEAYIGYG